MQHRFVAVLLLIIMLIGVFLGIFSLTKGLFSELYGVVLVGLILLLIMAVVCVGLLVMSLAIEVKQQQRQARLVHTTQDGLLPIDQRQIGELGPAALANFHQTARLRASHPPVPRYYAPTTIQPPATGARPTPVAGERAGPTGTGPLPLRRVRPVPRRPEAPTGERAVPGQERSDPGY